LRWTSSSAGDIVLIMTNTATAIFTWLTGGNINGVRQGVEESSDGRARMYVRQADGSVSYSRWRKLGGMNDSLQRRVERMASW
jgi:hypothetical protein